MTQIFPSKITCPICENDFEIYLLASTNQMGAPDLDLRPPEMARSTMNTWTYECPHCSYVSADFDQTPEIKKEFLEPYLEFVKKNKRVLKMIFKRPVLFQSEKIYSQMSEELFFPILSKFGVQKEEQVFKLEFFTRGTAGIIDKWLMLDCEVPIPKIMEIVIDCINFSKNNI